ncbi:MAG: DUF4159 domain-containing protein [Pirellulaceae bacterium]
MKTTIPDRHAPTRPAHWLGLGWVIATTLHLVGIVPAWLTLIVSVGTLPLAWQWIQWARSPHLNKTIFPFVLSLASFLSWHTAVLFTTVFSLDSLRGNVMLLGQIGCFVIGLAWLVWFLEQASRRFELKRLAEPTDPRASRRGRLSWHPADPRAWYYGRKSRKLKQSLLTLITYAGLFWLVNVLILQLPGCQQIYELPAGGGKQQAVAQKVRIEKIVRKKYIVNPFSAIKFKVPPIDEVRLQLEEVTSHQYTIGYGEGTGAGFSGGTNKGRVRLIRLEYEGGDWDLNFGIGGDGNLLMEYGLLTRQKVADASESLRISQLDRFAKGKSPPVVFLTGQKNLSLSNNEIKSLREYLEDKNGMLFASSGSSHFHNQFMAMMNRLLPKIRAVPVPLDDIIHRVPFSVPTLPYVVPHGGKDALGWAADGRWLVYYHPGDISDAWADGHAGISPEIYESCYRLGINVINYGHIEYAKRLDTNGGPTP